MPKIIKHNGEEFNSEYTIGEDCQKTGLILESWGPSARNPDYNKALDMVLSRLKAAGLKNISIFIISRELASHFPQTKRTVSVDDRKKIILTGDSTKNIRLKIGRSQAQIKINPKSKGGNRSKRILIHNPLMTSGYWIQVAEGTFSESVLNSHINEPTSNRNEFEEKVAMLLEFDLLPEPQGVSKPSQKTQSGPVYERDPKIKAWVLKNAKGKCEVCRSNAPFVKENGTPYLEVHHMWSLAAGGSDTLKNTVALCPNCHKKLHYAIDKKEMCVAVMEKINRLEKE